MTLSRTLKLYKLPAVGHGDACSPDTLLYKGDPNFVCVMCVLLCSLSQDFVTPGVRPMVEADIPQAFPLLAAYLTKFQLAQKYTAEEFQHWLLTRKGVVYSFVIEVRHRGTDPMSF